MADRAPASPSAAGDRPGAAPRPFDRSLLEATLADATRAVEAATVAAEADGSFDDIDCVARPSTSPSGPVVAVTRPAGPPLPGRPTTIIDASSPRAVSPPPVPAAGGPTSVPGRPRLAAPGAQALLSAAAPAAPVEDRAVDAGRLRVGASPSLRSATTPAGGGVTLPVVGARGLGPAPTSLVPPAAPPSAAPSPAVKATEPSTPVPGAVAGTTANGRPAPDDPAQAAASGHMRATTARREAPPRPTIRPWEPADDDILPSQTARGRGRFRLR